MSDEKPVDIREIVRFMKSNPIFHKLQLWIDQELAREREYYENSEASEFLRGRVAILKHLKSELEK